MCAVRALAVLSSAIAAAACSPSGSPASSPVAATVSMRIAEGQRLYEGNCMGCHQQSGQGIPGVYPSLAASAVVLGDPGVLAAWIVKGRRPALAPAGRYPTVMPQFVWLRPGQAASLLTYLRASFGNHAAAVDPAAITPALEP